VGESYQIHKNSLYYLPCVRSSKIPNKRDFLFKMKIDPSKIVIIKERKHEDIQEYFRASDVLICPSLYEAFGFVNMEAMAAKIPVIASEVGGIPEIVKDRYNGLLFKAGDSKDLAEKIFTLLGSSKMRKKLSKNAYNFIKRYNFPKHINYLDKLYSKIYEEN
jgi:glycosyltransferase involved in cell wall biosynthesis